jgi:hypothetical protein
VRPLAETTLDGRVPLHSECCPEFSYQLLPLAICWSSRKIDHAGHPNRETKRLPHRDSFRANVDSLRSFCDASRLDSNFLADTLKLAKSERPGFTWQRPLAHVVGRRKTENLAYLLLHVSALCHAI